MHNQLMILTKRVSQQAVEIERMWRMHKQNSIKNREDQSQQFKSIKYLASEIHSDDFTHF